MKLRLRLFLCQLDELHLVQLLLPGHGHVPGGHPGLVPGHEVLELRDLLLLAPVGGLQLGLSGGIDLLELVIVSHIAVQLLILHVVDQIDHAVQEGDVMGDQDEGVFIFLEIAPQPLDMLHVQVVGGLVQKEDIRLLQKELGQKDLGTLASGKLGYVPVQAQVRKLEGPGDLLYLGVDHVKVMGHEKLLKGPKLLHLCIHLFIGEGSASKLIADPVHISLHIEEEGKGVFQHVPDGLPLFQDRMLVQIAHPDVFRPFDLTLVRHKLIGDDAHEGGFSLSVGTDQSDVLPLQEPEAYVLKNSPVSEAVAQMFYIQNTHVCSP